MIDEVLQDGVWVVPAYSRRVEGVRYIASDKPEWMDLKPTLTLVNEVWKEKR